MTDDTEPTFYWAEVVDRTTLSPNLVRLTFGGEDLRRYRPAGVADECVALYFPAPGDARPPAMQCVDGVWWYHDDATRPEGRNYTVRRVTGAGELVIDFVAHDGGVAASWALSARPGDVVVVTPPRHWFAPPADTAWFLLAADLAGLPALGRVLEELPANTRAHAIVEVLDEADVQTFESAAEVTVQWCIGSGNGHGPGVLPDAVQAWEFPPGEGYVFFAGEAADSRAVRKYVRREQGMGVDRFDIIGYWRVRAEQWLAKYTAVEKEVSAVYVGALQEGRSESEAALIYDEALEKVGL
ncbi:siderophore-interacting protein [Rhodococcus sp. BP-241]|uniref:siderophore-interacting protein n=1 Tax=Rhodococcus sp. BP-241 TaxID=2739441 RepID=UPI001C9B8DDF|nr:siderophore-interacting protein [Rhodococcus sp. BP-241]MBY6708457.1 siderophore-interacting protein [Rhodococcus sp. BP-241]